MYYAPSELQTALEVASYLEGKVVAGGTDVFPTAQQGKMPNTFLDVTGIPELRAISHDSNGTRIGAAVTWSEIATADLPPAFDALRQAALEVGSIQIQNAGTIAGNLCNASPAADGVPPLLALDAFVEVASKHRGVRSLPLAEFLLNVRKTALAADELVIAITIPPIREAMGAAFEKLGSRRYLVISITMTAAMIACDAQGKIIEARVAVGACSPVARRLTDLEASLIGQQASGIKIDPSHLSVLSPIADVRGSKEFRLDVVAEQCERAIRRAAKND
ncbi:CO or xanthine dehydrogenase, FAD-binding subunit [Octadecabacter temperatus]|uniref:6-hydroxypseudooxynicotine dehydrogenase complex subunit alpha n=1 Tax=Octadecabacter temperatus TaxID=1458307 RepID=A0A0K0Y2K6_9RHOB|nr:FAD binding domain-containing protein [Octadecabacter temperatus]AKS45155.1 6-hydroxypseudooxynicotine dehydrogenase complex subunit alpha [Octadecabacter temperatus]SIN87275.1 CO or xanthine dehydrogenase, FAD-binding subunit [Octadecabacter temperatus]